MNIKPNMLELFHSRVSKNGPLPDQRKSCYKGLDRCWMWNGTKFSNGYGRCWTGYKDTQAHRVSLYVHKGVDPHGHFVMHRCDNKSCVNPDHLVPGTPDDNMKDMCRKGRAAAGDRNGSVKYPSRLTRGTKHWTRQRPHDVPVGESSPVAVLTAEDVSKIRIMYASGGYTQESLAREFGVAQCHVSQIVRRVIWKHIP